MSFCVMTATPKAYWQKTSMISTYEENLGLVIMAGVLLESAVLAHAESIKEACRYEALMVSNSAAMVTIGKGNELKRLYSTPRSRGEYPLRAAHAGKALATVADFEC